MKTSLLSLFFFCVSVVGSLAVQAGTIVGITQFPTTPSNSPAGTTGLYDKFELAFSLSSPVNNPYDPIEVSVETVFTSPGGKQHTRFGFFYEDFTVHDLSIVANDVDNYLVGNSSTPNPWRVRYAPDEVGNWQYSVTVRYNSGAAEPPITGSFQCVTTANKGFLKIAPNKRNLMFDNGASFFAIGSNVDYWGTDAIKKPLTVTATMPSCNGSEVLAPIPVYFPNTTTPNSATTVFKFSTHTFAAHDNVFRDLHQKGGNFARVWMQEFNWDIETYDPATGANTAGNYGPNQNRMYDFDRVINSAKENGVYIHLSFLDGIRLWNQGINGDQNKWLDFPYKRLPYLNLDSPLKFFTNATAYELFKNKIRYIVSRWGYSPNISSYELINEGDFVHVGGDAILLPPGQYGINTNSTNFQILKTWTFDMATYLKSIDSKHLHALAYGPETAAGIIPSPDISGLYDFTVSHFYSGSFNMELQKNYLAQSMAQFHDKPYQTQEWDYLPGINTWNSDGETKFHTTNWATAFSGAFGVALHLSAFSNLHNPCNGPYYGQYAPLANFISHEFNSSSENIPIGNSTATAKVMYPSSTDSHGYDPGMLRTINATNLSLPITPLFASSACDKLGCSGAQEGFGISGQYWRSTLPDYVVSGIELLNPNPVIAELPADVNAKIEVFALKNKNKIIGWAHNKTHYWYNMSRPPLNEFTANGTDRNTVPNSNHSSNCFHCTQNPPEDETGHPVDQNGNQIPVGIPADVVPLSGMQMVVKGIANGSGCQGSYTIKWFYTHVNSDPDGNTSPNEGDGGFIHANDLFPGLLASSTAIDIPLAAGVAPGSQGIASNGDLVVNIPTLRKLGASGSLEAPDYAFVITKVDDADNYTTNTAQWSHDIPSPPQTSQQMVAGNYVSTADGNDIFYRGGDGHIQHLKYNVTGKSWVREGALNTLVSAQVSPNDYRVKSGGKIIVNNHNLTNGENNFTVYYEGADGRLQHYFFYNGWGHDYTTSDVNPAHQVAGDMVASHAFGYDQVTYRGADGYLQRRYFDGVWKHDYLVNSSIDSPPGNTDWQVKADSKLGVNVAGFVIFYTGTNGRMHHYGGGGGGTIWSHNETDYWISTPGNAHYVDGNFAVCLTSNGQDQVVYRGKDEYLHRLYWNGSQWAHAYMWSTNAGSMPSDTKVMPESKIAVNASSTRIYYRGAYSDMQRFSTGANDYSHDYLSWAAGAGSAPFEVKQGGDIVATSASGFEQVLYVGNDNYIQRYYQGQGGVMHDWVLAGSAPASLNVQVLAGTSILVNNMAPNNQTTSIFFQVAGSNVSDVAMHRYHFSCTQSNQRATNISPANSSAIHHDFSCYPNPTHNCLTIAFNIEKESANVKAALYNIMGQKVQDIVSDKRTVMGDNLITVDNINLASGIYYLLFFEDGVLTHKQSIAIE